MLGNSLTGRKRLATTFLALSAAVLLAIPAGQAAGVTISSYWVNGNGHGSVTYQARNSLDFYQTSNEWMPTSLQWWVNVYSGDVRCERFRVFESGWTLVSNDWYDGAPFPFASWDGTQTGDWTWSTTPILDWGLRVWSQFDDSYAGGGCDYGGGVGLQKPSYAGSYSTEPIASP